MNKFSGELGLEKTNFAVVHGLMNKNNISTASDIAYLSSIAI
jgi:D-alanyl-D-alanine carboxypeptidase